jgi:hypothetical protein
MRNPSVSFAAVAGLCALLSSQVSAQQRPNFAGRWVLVSDTAAYVDGPLGREGTVTQDERSVTFTSGTRSVTYRLDRPETVNTTTTVRGDSWTLVSQVRWVQHALLVTTTTRSPIGTWEDMMVCSLDGRGNLNIVVLSTPKDWHAAMITTLLTYRRKTQT